MATKRIQRSKRHSRRAVDPGSLWLAGIGAVSLARKHGAEVLADLVGEGRRLQVQTTRLARETRRDAYAQATGLLKPVKARIVQQAKRSRAAIRSGVAGALAEFGIPSKADIDRLSQRIGTLNRQLKTAK